MPPSRPGLFAIGFGHTPELFIQAAAPLHPARRWPPAAAENYRPSENNRNLKRAKLAAADEERVRAEAAAARLKPFVVVPVSCSEAVKIHKQAFVVVPVSSRIFGAYLRYKIQMFIFLI